MNDNGSAMTPSREQLVHRLYEAAELEHNLMCTYLYAAFSLRRGESEGLDAMEAEAVERWHRTIIRVAIEEMEHLVAVWNITTALGAAPRFGRMNFPLDPGYLPASVVVKLAPFNEKTLQHFIYLERPGGSLEADGEGFEPPFLFTRGSSKLRLTPTALDYDTVGAFYQSLSEDLSAFAREHGETVAFCGARNLQLSAQDAGLPNARPVICLKTALQAFDRIVLQGEGAPADSEQSHFRRFLSIRDELARLKARNPAFKPAHPAATNPVLRRPPRPEGRVWLEDDRAVAAVDLANASYGLMLRLLAYAYAVPAESREKSLAVEVGTRLMQLMSLWGEQAARLPAGPSNPHCNAGMSFTAMRDTGALPVGPAARRFFIERLTLLSDAARELADQDKADRAVSAARKMAGLLQYAQKAFGQLDQAVTPVGPGPLPSEAAAPSAPAPASSVENGVETVEGSKLRLHFEAKRCIHARFCVTGAPRVFLANVQGPWIFPDAMDVERLVDIAHACPSGAIRYERLDGRPGEAAPPVNLVSIREAGPYAVRGELTIGDRPPCHRATLCRCGASRNKPFCDGSHHDAGFTASGEPVTGINGSSTEMLEHRDGPIAIEPEPDGPLSVRGNLEIVSGTGRMVCRVTQARLCRCGGSGTKPFCDGTHQRNGFRSE